MRPPSLIHPTKGPRVRVDESNQYLRYNPPTDGAKAMTSGTRVGFAKDVVPERGLALPTCRSDANLLRGEWSNSDVTGYGFARREPAPLAALQVTNGKRMIVVNLTLTRDGHWQRNECSHKFAIDFL
jgi:hypothetical protein